MTHQHLSRTMIAAFLATLCAVAPASAQTPPSVGNAQTFAVLGGTSVTAAGVGSVITGDVGVSPGTSITGFPAGATVVPPFSTHVNDGQAIAAQTSTTALYNTLAAAPAGTALGAELGGLTLVPGTYSISSSANIASGTTLTLTGEGVFIFKVGSSLTANVLSNVLLINGANPCNVFFQVTSAATLNGTTFAGNVVAQAAITLGVGAALNGRALTTSAGSVTLAGGNRVGGCSGAVAAPVCPAITILPASLPNGTVGVAFSQTLTGSGGPGPFTFAVTAGTLAPGLTLTSAGVLAGTPTAAGTSVATIRGTAANGCFAELSLASTIVPPVPVPTLPQVFFVLLASGLAALGYARLRRRA